ncbi:hypothetical protein [Marinobacterium marinum]|uniref:Uncharacterized protein n=1 Tax=Marinobacterium marinum TaxID=2756129 RepID=A0A7W1WZY7_9GAMM|nr:hypothetical protein [Marinobacterium marinum]MBA4503227.1 hypothetical protein [Marinobacterium marinum]
MDKRHNPLIAETAVDTYINVLNALFTLKELQSDDDTGRMDLTPRATFGLSLLMGCITGAMEFEQERDACANM